MEQPPLYNDAFAEFDITPYSSSLAQLANLPSPTHEEPSMESGNTPYPTNDDLVPPPYESADMTTSLLDQQTPTPVSPPRPQSLYQQTAQQTPQRTTQSTNATNQAFPTFASPTPQSPVQQLGTSQAQSQITHKPIAQQPSISQLQAQQQAQQQAQLQAQQQAQLQAQQAQQQQMYQQQQQAMARMLQQQQQAQQQAQQAQQQQAQQAQQAQQQAQQQLQQQAQLQAQQNQHQLAHAQQSTPSGYESQQSYGYPQIQSAQVIGSVYPSTTTPQVQSVQNLYGQNSTKDALNQIQTYFDKISGFMERLDRRMAALEITAQNIAKNGGSSGVSSEVGSLKKMHVQVESDFDVAKRLQDELNVKYEKEKRKEAKKKAKAASQAKLASSSGSTPRPASTSNSSVQECPICAVKVPIADLEVHVNSCLEGTEKPLAGGNNTMTENGDKPTFWKRVFGPGPKKDETPSPPSNALVPANRMPPPPMRTVTTPGVYGQEYYPQPQPQQGPYVYRPYGQPVPPQVYGYPGQQPIYYYNPNMPPKR